jgi:hypothetical protein
MEPFLGDLGVTGESVSCDLGPFGNDIPDKLPL